MQFIELMTPNQVDNARLNPSQTQFLFADVHLSPKEQIGMHSQNTWELTLIIEGEGMRFIGDRNELFRKGEIILIPPGIPHCWYFDPEVTDSEGKIANIAIMFGEAFLQRCCACFEVFSEIATFFRIQKDALKFDSESSAMIESILINMRRENNMERLSSVIRLFALIVAKAKGEVVGSFRKTDKVEQRMIQIDTYIVCNANRNISLSDMACHLGMNKVSFCSFFKKATGKTFITYLNDYRIRLACEYLLRDNADIADICYTIGFDNIPYFNRLFKRVTGLTPGAFRRKNLIHPSCR